eukprot:TRINITY_DN7141_c0_g2_i1.p1 TRINITY_DN7141_c0_g2~~TRINITY_DN7141_c0_g2_i1.p1  ORF type:complete len:692 (+),score=51.28 TRINITY_DN7141_c0_g2_i1:221-2077(+)
MDDSPEPIPSRATLIFCPNHLVQQWSIEIAKSTKPPLKVGIITTKLQHAQFSYADFAAKLDVILISFQFFVNPNYFMLSAPGTTKMSLQDRHHKITTALMILRRRKNMFREKSPILEHFRFHRLVVDEGHEVLAQSKDETKPTYYLTTMNNIYSRFRWYVSGTPFAEGLYSYAGALEFLQVSLQHPHPASVDVYHSNSLSMDVMPASKIMSSCLFTHRLKQGDRRFEEERNLLSSLVHKYLYMRNTKDSFGERFMWPDLHEGLLWLELSDVDRGIYNSASSTSERLRARQICCHLQLSDTDVEVIGTEKRTLEEVRNIMIQFEKDKLARLNRQLETQTKEEADARGLNRLEVLRSYADRISTTKKKIVETKSSLAFFESIVPYVRPEADVEASQNDECPICLDTMAGPTITACGHLFCHECIVSTLTLQGRCPSCRRTLTIERDITQVVLGSEDDKHIISDELQGQRQTREIVQKYGTKMAHLVMKIRQITDEDPTAKIIVFSQWTKMLHRVGDTLAENGIANVYVEGNVFKKNRAISKFHSEGGERVMMLSLEHAASGTNLMEATHVILLDPISESAERARRSSHWPRISSRSKEARDGGEDDHEKYCRTSDIPTQL